jgi:hypothetical protein
MDGDGYDFFSQESAAGNTWATTANGHGGGARLHGGFEAFDLNSQAADGFPNIGEYGALLQGDADQPLGRSRSSGLPPQPPLRAPRSLGVPNQRARGGSGWGGRAPQSVRHLNFGASSSSAASRGEHGVESSIGASAGARQRVNTAPTRRPTARSNTSQRGGGGTRGRVSRPPAARNAGIIIGGSGQSFNDDDEQTDDVEELDSIGGFPVSQGTRAYWSDENNACLLDLAIEQRRTGRYSGAQMSGEGYKAVIQGLRDRRGLVHERDQVRNQLRTLKKVYNFWCYLEKHTGLGRKPDGTVDAESNWWKTHTEVEFYHLSLMSSFFEPIVIAVLLYIALHFLAAETTVPKEVAVRSSGKLRFA